MRLDFDNWIQRSLSVEHLKLDIDNPRFSYFAKRKMNQTEIVKYLVEKFEVYDLAKEIATKNYYLNEMPIVCKEDDSYVVLEGNRRVAACKVLLNPHKYLSNQRAQNILKYNFSIEKLNCHVAPTRKEADILIYNRHTSTPIKRWERVSQDAHIHKLFEDGNSLEDIATMLSETTTDIRKSLRRYHAHQFSMKLMEDNTALKEAVSNDKFPITNFERFYENKDGMDFLGISFDSNGAVKRRLDIDELKKRFRFIMEEIVSDNLNSRIFNRDSDKKDYIEQLKSLSDIFDFSKKLSDPDLFSSDDFQETNDAERNTESQSQPEPKKGKPRKQNKLFGEKNWMTGLKRIDDIFKSLQYLKNDKHIDVISIGFRCYLDMIVYEFLKEKECLEDVCLMENSKYNKEKDIDFKKVKNYMKDNYSLLEEEIKDDFRYILKLDHKSSTDKTPSLRWMLSYISTKPELLPDSRARSALQTLLKGENQVVDLNGFNQLVHNQYFHIETSQLENTVLNLLPLLEHINSVIIND